MEVPRNQRLFSTPQRPSGTCYTSSVSTELEVHNVIFKWKLENISSRNFVPHFSYESTRFQDAEKKQYFSFKLISDRSGEMALELRKESVCSHLSASFYPRLPCSDAACSNTAVTFSAAVVNAQGTLTHVSRGEVFEEQSSIKRKFLSVKLLDKALVNNTLTILCEVHFIDMMKGLHIREPSASFITKDIKQVLHMDKTLTDVSVIAGGREVRVHKAILSARSDVFRAMFANNMKESFKNEVRIDDMTDRVLQELVHFMYTDEVSTCMNCPGINFDILVHD